MVRFGMYNQFQCEL